MNKINLVIDMRTDFLRFSNFTSNQKSIVLLTSNKTITKQKSLTSTHILKRSFTTSQSSLKSLSFSSMNIAMIETATYKMLVKQSDVKIFAVIILKID